MISPAEQPSPDGVRHFPELDGVRGLAILMVLVAHSSEMLGVIPNTIWDPGYFAWGRLARRILFQGWGGVDIFFALSGFLITGILLRSRLRQGYFRNFYARRALRIFPIYYAFLIISLILGRLSMSYSVLVPHTIDGILPFFLYIQNWPVFWKSWYGMGGVWGAFWSLAVEEQFYLLWPTLVRFLKPLTLMWACVVGTFVGFFLRSYFMLHHGVKFGVMQGPVFRLDGLFIGAAIALYRHVYGRPLSLPFGVMAIAIGLAILGYTAARFPSQFEGLGYTIWRIGPLAFALIGGGLIAVSHYRPRGLDRILTWQPLLTAGKLSYGMYVYHLAVVWVVATYIHPQYFRPHSTGLGILFAAVAMLLFILVVTFIAALSYRFFEAPLLALKRHFPSPAAPV